MINVVVVDDDPLVRQGLKVLINWEELGAELKGIAKDGDEAWELIKSGDIQLVITDVKMPNMDGITLLKKIREVDKKIAVILLSAYADFTYAKEAINYGVLGYITKPVDSAALGELSELVKRVNRESADNTINEMITGEQLEFEVLEIIEKNDSELLKNKIIDVDTRYGNINLDSLKKYYVRVFTIVGNALSVSTVAERIITDMDGIKDIAALKRYAHKSLKSMQHIINVKRMNNLENAIDYIKEYIGDNFHNPELNVNRLGDIFGVAIAYLADVFGKKEGITMSQYIMSLRMKHGKKMLENTNFSIKEIAHRCGYEDPGLFARNFKKTYEYTPVEFRNKYADGLKGETE